jgi:hypothetical protein
MAVSAAAGMMKNKKIREIILGKPLDPMQSATRHSMALVAFLAWVGLGADGLSSSAYGPEETFRALGTHTHLGLYLAIATAVTVFVIALAYNQVIDLFPTGAGLPRGEPAGRALSRARVRLRADPRLRADHRDLDRVRRRRARVLPAARLPALYIVGRGVLHWSVDRDEPARAEGGAPDPAAQPGGAGGTAAPAFGGIADGDPADEDPSAALSRPGACAGRAGPAPGR